jgi:hypothetical protein
MAVRPPLPLRRPNTGFNPGSGASFIPAARTPLPPLRFLLRLCRRGFFWRLRRRPGALRPYRKRQIVYQHLTQQQVPLRPVPPHPKKKSHRAYRGGAGKNNRRTQRHK